MKQFVRVFLTDVCYSHFNKDKVLQGIMQRHVDIVNREGLKVVSFKWSDDLTHLVFLCEGESI